MGSISNNSKPKIHNSDSNYTGEVAIGVVNLNKEPTIVKKQDRIAQIEIVPQRKIVFTEVSSLEDNEDRGSKGFGSSGIS